MTTFDNILGVLTCAIKKLLIQTLEKMSEDLHPSAQTAPFQRTRVGAPNLFVPDDIVESVLSFVFRNLVSQASDVPVRNTGAGLMRRHCHSA